MFFIYYIPVALSVAQVKGDIYMTVSLYKNIHALLIAQGERVLIEEYFTGNDEQWGQDVGKVAFNAHTLHDIRSITKSVIAMLYGIARKNRLVPSVKTPIIHEFPSYNTFKHFEQITIEHVLTMTMGLAWSESTPYLNDVNDEIAMEMSFDRYGFILSKPVIAEPGRVWCYSGGATALLGGIIQRGSGLPLSEFCNNQLFRSLDITHTYWHKGEDGIESAASGLRLTARDLLKIGGLILNNGIYLGQVIVPSFWCKKSFTPWASTGDAFFGCYGYHWFLSFRYSKTLRKEVKWLFALGNGGQVLGVSHELRAVVVIFSGEYNKDVVWDEINDMFEEVITPFLIDHAIG